MRTLIQAFLTAAATAVGLGGTAAAQSAESDLIMLTPGHTSNPCGYTISMRTGQAEVAFTLRDATGHVTTFTSERNRRDTQQDINTLLLNGRPAMEEFSPIIERLMDMQAQYGLSVSVYGNGEIAEVAGIRTTPEVIADTYTREADRLRAEAIERGHDPQESMRIHSIAYAYTSLGRELERINMRIEGGAARDITKDPNATATLCGENNGRSGVISPIIPIPHY